MKHIAQTLAIFGFSIVIFFTGITLAQTLSEARVNILQERVAKSEVRIELVRKDIDSLREVLIQLFFLVGGGFIGTGGLVIWTGKRKC